MTKDEVQRAAVKAWVKKKKVGTLELSTGTGKTIASLHCLRTMPPRDGTVHLFLAETDARLEDLENDINKYKELFDYDIRKNYNLVFKCYQGAYKLKDYKFGLVIADEIHMSLTPTYSKFFENNEYQALVGLTATVEKNTSYDMGYYKLTKGDLLNKYAPVCYRYTQKDALDDSIGRPLDVYVIEMTLNDVDKTEKSGSPKNPFYQTEYAKYQYLEKNFHKSFYAFDEAKRSVMIRNTYKWRSDFITNMSRRLKQAKTLVENIPGKSIVFGTTLDSVLEVTKNTVSSKNTPEQNEKIRSDFESNKIQTIGSYKMLRQGANLTGLDNCIQLSYHGAETHMVQITGRLRKNGDKKGRVVLFVMKDTYEEDMLNKILGYIKYDNLYTFKNAEDLLIHLYNE